MSKSIKLKDNTYIDSTGVVHNRTLLSEILDNIMLSIYPVGSIYISTVSTDPSTIFGGTWEQIKDRFLLACGNSYSNGSTGGNNTHQHDLPIAIDTTVDNWNILQWNNSFRYGYNTISVPNHNLINNTPVGSSKTLYQLKTAGASSLPPYLAVYVWKRTA